MVINLLDWTPPQHRVDEVTVFDEEVVDVREANKSDSGTEPSYRSDTSFWFGL